MRKLLAVCALVSLLLGAGTVWWWVRSGQQLTQVTARFGARSMYQLWGCANKLALMKVAVPATQAAPGGQLSWSTIPYDPSGATPGLPALKWTSFSYTNQPSADNGGAELALILPAWAVVGACTVLPTAWAAGTFKPRKKKPH